MLRRLGRVIYWVGCAIAVVAVASFFVFIAWAWMQAGSGWGQVAAMAAAYLAVPGAVAFGVGRAALYILADE